MATSRWIRLDINWNDSSSRGPRKRTPTEFLTWFVAHLDKIGFEREQAWIRSHT